MKPEEKAEIILWDWFKTQSKNIEEIYFNRKNELDWKIFKVVGKSRKIPDMILKINDGYGIKFCVVEIKDASKSMNVLRGCKVIDTYFKNYIEKKTRYLIDDKEVKIDYFTIASQSSLKGYLFKEETFVDNSSDEESKSKILASIKYKIIPLKEGNRTYEFIRFLWRIYAELRQNYEEKCGLGIIIGNSEKNFAPHLMITNYDINKKRWSQRFWEL
jgi:hypothetical protein